MSEKRRFTIESPKKEEGGNVFGISVGTYRQNASEKVSVNLNTATLSQIDLLVDTKKEIESVIERVPDADCRLLLEMRYLAMESWIDVAAEMNVSRSYVHRLHEKALGMVEKILQERSAGLHE